MKTVAFAMPRFSIFRLALLIVGAGLLVAGCTASAAPPPDSRDATIAQGRQMFVANCAACHGEKGDRVPVAPLNVREFLDLRGDATLVHVISEGKGVMPAWGQMRGGPLTQDQISAVVAYLNASAGRTSPTILASSGRAVFQQQCTGCHGEKGDRIPAAPLAGKAFLDTRTDPQLTDVVNNGKGQMPAFRNNAANPLSEEQIQAVVSYLRYNADTQLAEEARQGRDLFTANCLGCHGERGDRVPNVLLHSSDWLRRLGDGRLTAVIADGSGVMPGFGPAKGGAFQAAQIGALLAYLKSAAGLPAGSALVGTEVPSAGRDLYLRSCSGCHGEGGDKVAGLNLKAAEFLDSRTDDALQRQIAQGNSRGMPAWGQPAGGPLSTADIKNLIDYLRGRNQGPAAQAQPRAPKPAVPQPAATVVPAQSASTIAASDDLATKGKEVYGKYCLSCHGESRDKMPAAKLADASWLQQRGDATLTQSIANGKESMPGWGKEKGGPLSPDDIAGILAYLKKAAGASPSGSVQSPGQQAAPADASKGQALYARSCAACHGEGRDKIASANLADSSWLQQRGDTALGQSIANGKDAMPSWGKEKGGPLAQEDIAAIIAYLKSAAAGTTTPKPTLSGPPPVLTGDAAHGQDVFGKICSACHGDSRDKIAAAKLASSSWLDQRGDAALAASIANGKGAMPAWGQDKGGPLSPVDIAAILVFLKALAAGG